MNMAVRRFVPVLAVAASVMLVTGSPAQALLGAKAGKS